ncbi:hypothetical protein KRX11_05570 [Pasteurellaceae bacterium TAE3-ERU1]|nr:hypothetical protein [Pasteurellaceae bacterium TAE3-ERU1]
MRNLDKLISSSMLASFFIGLGWSVAYVYGWAQSYYYGYPWELVDVGIANIARSIGYVLFLSLIAFTLYWLGLAFLLLAKPHLPCALVKILRAFIFCTVLSAPIMIQVFLFMHRINYPFIALYLFFALTFSLLFRNKLKSLRTSSILAVVTSHKHNLAILALGIYLYFIISAFMLGYFRPAFRQEYPVIALNQTLYYVLTKSDDKLILAQSLAHDNRTFYLTPCNLERDNICRFSMITMEN